MLKSHIQGENMIETDTYNDSKTDNLTFTAPVNGSTRFFKVIIVSFQDKPNF